MDLVDLPKELVDSFLPVPPQDMHSFPVEMLFVDFLGPPGRRTQDLQSFPPEPPHPAQVLTCLVVLPFEVRFLMFFVPAPLHVRQSL